MNINLKQCLSEDALRCMCNGIRDAIDNTRASLAGYPTHNSWATRFWDEINNYLIKHIMVLMGVENCEVFITNRGPWLLGMAYSNGIVYSFMGGADIFLD